MGTKLSVDTIKQLSIEKPNEGFDNCHFCKGVETQYSMHYIETAFNHDDILICDECQEQSFNIIQNKLDDAIDEVFVTAHEVFKTKSGDITPNQTQALDSLKAQIFDLILEQVKQNL